MLNVDEYVALVLTTNMSEIDKIKYLKILYSIKNYSKEQLETLEDKIYMIDKRPLSDIERIICEINYLHAYYKSKGKDLTEIRKLYYKIRGIKGNKEELNKIKKYITKLQIDNSLPIRFYNSYLDLLEEIRKQNRRKTQRTFHK